MLGSGAGVEPPRLPPTCVRAYVANYVCVHVRLRDATEPLTWSGRSAAASETACVRSRELRSVRSRTLLILLVTLRTERMKPLLMHAKARCLAIAECSDWRPA